MNIIFILIPIAMIMAGIAIWAFFWSINNGQYDDLDGAAHSILYDDDENLIPEEARPHTNKQKDTYK